jgi:hypothetical protein
MKNNCGSLQNEIFSNSQSNTPEVGMGATQIRYTDRRAYTVIEIVSAKEVVVQRDKAIRTDVLGWVDYKTFQIEQDPKGHTRTLVLKKSKKHPNGKWVVKGDPINGERYIIGMREEYFDPNF